MTTELRTSQVEVLRLAKRFGGSVQVWQVAEDRHSNNWEAVLLLDTLVDLGYLDRLPSPSVQGARMADETFQLTQLGHEALEGEG